MKFENIEYDFKETTPLNFELCLSFSASSSLFNLILNTSLWKLKKQIGKVKQIEIKEFEIDKRYYQLINTNIKPIIDLIDKEIKKDKKAIIVHTLNKAMCKKEQKYYRVCLKLEGVFKNE
jgi:hypothetical protein